MTSLWGPSLCNVPYFDINLVGATTGNLHSAEFFAAAIGGLIALFTISHWVRYPFEKKSSMHMIRRVVSTPFELFRSLALRKVLGFTSVGHAMVVFIYVVINTILLFTMLDWPLPQLSDFARRLGWVAVANIAFLFFLALRNTPLAFLTEYSYERLNVLHQIAGYTTILLSALHTILFIVARSQQNQICNILDIPQHPSMIAMGAMLIILFTSLFLKGWKYEAFFVIHIIMAVLVLFGVGLHRPDFGTYTVPAIIFTAAIFIADQAARAIRMIYNRRNQTAILTPLPAGGTLVELTQPVYRAVPGKHACLMIGKLGNLQTHPFTIVSTTPVKFIIDSYSGFTQRLHERAIKEPGVALKATLDGPYGTLPAFHKYDRVILIAGGSGASFIFAVAVELLKKLQPSEKIIIECVWALRDTAKLEWFTPELQALQSSPLVNLSIYSTGSPSTEKVLATAMTPEPELEMAALAAPFNRPAPVRGAPLPTLFHGRPDVPSIIREVIRSTSPDERIVVAACGPESLMNATRNSTASCIKVGGPMVELHIEQFGW